MAAVRVTGLETFLVHPGGGKGKNWLFVKVLTDAGVHGWGEAYTQLDRDRAIEIFAQEMGRYLVGRDPFAIKHFTHTMYHDFVGKRGSVDFFSALSAIEQALWDVVGKALGTPVYNLLGGPCRDRIRVYANGWSGGAKTPAELVERAREVLAMGFDALKWDPFPDPWRAYIGPDEERAAVESVRAMREALGPDVELLVEVHRRLAPMYAVRIARQIEQYRPFWYEEPVSAQNLDALAEVRRQIAIPVVTGEELYTKSDFRQVFEKRAVDIINPDVCNVGGILELKEIAAMAEPSYVAVSPHNYNSTTIGLAATVQASAVMPNFLITEYFVNFEAVGKEIARPPLLPERGSIPLPTTPGLGIELDEEALRARAYLPFPARTLRRVSDEP
ncbi:MAG: mandelate racemase/muconate lactonizing enzyme family protein [Chloroflexi bacterium]|nr:mandelate racemase/muconate lactonizing enzyme family protein [Chloroflexota bacterium]